MKKLEGFLIGAIVVATLLGVGWWAGWIQVARPTDVAVAPAGAGMPMGSSAAENPDPALDEHAGHDMAAMEMAEPAPAADMPAGAVMISPQRQQLIGVRTAPVLRRSLDQVVRTVGKVDYDETRVAHIHTKVTGWIETLHVDFTGKLVELGQPLLEIYSPELVATQEEYLLALRALDSLGESQFAEVASSSRSLLAATRRRLELLDVSNEQIVLLEARREPVKTLTLYSPIRGYVTYKAAYEGQFVDPTADLFTIADLSEVWVTADIYEQDLPNIRLGQRATVTLSYMPGQTFRGRVDYVYPYLEGETRTAKVRVVLPNQNAILKPGMFANVELVNRLGEAIVVPEDAVIDTGMRKVVFLVLPGGHFLPREVQVGARVDGQLQVLAGLEEGDTVVSGAAFLIDSESKLRSAMGSMPGMEH